MQNNTLCLKPNQFAKPLEIQVFDLGVLFHGYQDFLLTRSDTLPIGDDHALKKKVELLSRFFTPRHIQDRTFLDLGANAAFYCFWALQQHAAKATAVDIDEEYLNAVKKAKAHLGFGNLEVMQANVEDWDKPADVVNALALVHWLYSSTAHFGSLNAVVGKLAQLSRYMLIVEWVAPEDPAIQFFNHIDWNKNFAREPYTLENFEKALHQYFRKVEMIGEISETRKLYLAFHTEAPIYLNHPFPLLYPKEHLLSSQLLAEEDCIEYWSCVYEYGHKIYKQASIDLAINEANILLTLNSEYFPKVIDSFQEKIYSVVVIEKIMGSSLISKVDEISRDYKVLYEFIVNCLDILIELDKCGILHRDIRMANIMVRDKKPVLLDFGWAVSKNRTYRTPRGLGDTEKPPDGVYCDVYSMGRVLAQLCQSNHPYFMEVIALMTETDSYLRITNLGLLKTLFDMASKKEAQHG